MPLITGCGRSSNFFRFNRNFLSVPPTVSNSLDFLQSSLDARLSCNIFKVQVSALSALTDTSWSKEPLVIRFLRAPIRPLFPKWDLPLVLRGMLKSPFFPDTDSLLWYLTMKTVFLTALVLAIRVLDIAAFCYREQFCTIFLDSVDLHPSPKFLPKVLSEFHFNWESVLRGQ